MYTLFKIVTTRFNRDMQTRFKTK